MMGGLMGFIKRGSVASLVGGCVSGAVVLLCAQKEMYEYQELSALDELDKFERHNMWVSITAAISCLLTFVMGLRYKISGKTMPLVVSIISAGMFLFYSHYMGRLAQAFIPLGVAVLAIVMKKVDHVEPTVADSKKTE
jgi:uncharacterized membrane protein (UPF0136 family)